MQKMEGIVSDHDHNKIKPSSSSSAAAADLPEEDSSTYNSGPLSKKPERKSTRFNIPEDSFSSLNNNNNNKDETYLEVTLDAGDSASIHSVKPIDNISNRKGNSKPPISSSTSSSSGPFSRLSTAGNAFSTTTIIRQVSKEFKRLTSMKKKPTAPPARRALNRSMSAAAPALEGLKFINKTSKTGCNWNDVEKRFYEITSSTDGLLPRARFGECIGMNKESKEFAGQLFDALTRRYDITGDSITKDQLKEFWSQISDHSFDSRLKTFFDMVDKDADGRITEDEVRQIIKHSASANKLSNIQKQADEYAALIMEELDTTRQGFIMIEDLEMLLLQEPHDTVNRVGETKKLSQVLSQKLKTIQESPVKRFCQSTRYFLEDNWKRVWLMALWIGAMAGLFAFKYIQYKNRAVYQVMGHCVCMAKGAAETLKFNMALILLPVCRNTITWLRNRTKLGVAVPFDDNLNFHKVIAVAISVGVGVHAIYHLSCDFPSLLNASEEKYAPMEQFFGKQPKSYWHFVKSVEGITGIVMVVLMAIAFTLATPWFRRDRLKLPKPLKHLTGFNSFWYSHHSFVIVYALLIVHGNFLYLTHDWYKKTTWMYLAIPVLLYGCERLTRALRSSIKPVTIQKVIFYPGDVLSLQMSKPQGFRYKSGQYMFVNCKVVSPFEWHPFSITSAPGDDHLSVHIKAAGDWTKQIKVVFSQVCRPPPTGKSGLLRADCNQGDYNPSFPRVLIDGPYGAPAQDYKEYEVVLLVGLGIGATPMISIVKDIVNNIKEIEDEENALENGAKPPTPSQQRKKDQFKTRRAYFYWVTREQGSFDWFKGIMNEVAESDHNHVIELHNYCTSVYEEGDARSALITMLQSLNHAKHGVDVVSGTRVMTHFAKPKWRDVYKSIAVNHPNSRIGVFYCGPPALTKELRQLASDFSHKTSHRFDFHKENF